MSFFKDIYNKAKNSINDDEGWFRQGRFSPVQQVKSMTAPKQLLSPIPQNQVLSNQNSFSNKQVQQPQFIAPPKPTFKTQAAEKLSSRLEAIKRFGTSKLDEIENSTYGKVAKSMQPKSFMPKILDTQVATTGEGFTATEPNVSSEESVSIKDFLTPKSYIGGKAGKALVSQVNTAIPALIPTMGGGIEIPKISTIKQILPAVKNVAPKMAKSGIGMATFTAILNALEGKKQDSGELFSNFVLGMPFGMGGLEAKGGTKAILEAEKLKGVKPLQLGAEEIINKTIPEKIGNILSKIKLSSRSGYNVKGEAIDAEKMLLEGWKPQQIDYAVKLANQSSLSKPDKGWGAYVRGILKTEYPEQASKMGGKIMLPEPSPQEVINSNRTADEILAGMEKPQPKPLVETPKVINEILAPKKEVPVKVETPIEAKLKVAKAELDTYKEMATTIDDMKQKEGIALDPITESRILSGEQPVSKELKALVDEKNQISSADLLEANPTFPKEKLKENYVPQVNVSKMSEEATTSQGFGSMLANTTFDPTMKRTGTLKIEEMATGTQGGIESKKAYLRKKYFVEEQANKIMKENNIPVEKTDKVLEFVKKEQENINKIDTEHLSKTKFGKSIDYIGDAKRYDEELSKITDKATDRPIILSNGNLIDPLIDKIRIDDTFFQQRTNPEIFDAFRTLRDSKLPDSPVSHSTALGHFIETATKYNYEDKYISRYINNFIDSELKSGKVIQGTMSKFVRLLSGLFSGTHIGGNVKTVIQQPTELFRITAEEGIKNLKPGIENAVSNPKRLIERYGLSDVNAQLLATNPEWKILSEKTSLLDKVGKTNDKILNITMSGMKFTEELKNIILASMAEQKGLKQGLKLDSLEMTKFVRDELFRVGHIGAKYSTPSMMENSAGMSGLFQYSQYALKNFVLKYDTIKNVEDQKRLYKVGAQLTADVMATLTIAMITGIPIVGIKSLFQNSALPNSFGPLLTVPYEYLSEAWKYYKDTNDPNKKPEDITSLAQTWGDTTRRNFMPVGNQISKTKKAIDVLTKGYDEFKKGNVTYPVGELNPVQKAQALIFGTGAIPNKQKSNKMYADIDKGTSTTYPTLTAPQSETFKSLPKDQQEAYYNQKIAGQKSAKDIVQEELNPKKPSMIDSILGRTKKTEAKSVSSILNSDTATQQEKTKAKAIIKEKIDSGNVSIANDEDLKAYFFGEIDKLPESSDSEKQDKTIEKYKKLDSIYSSETLDQETKDRLIKMSGIPEQDVEYYNLAKDDATVKAMRQEEQLSTMSRKEWFESLENGRKLIGNKQIVDDATITQLYERGVISKDESKYLKAIKFDPATKEYYLDRDYKASGDGSSSKRITALKSLISKLNTVSNKFSDKNSVSKAIDSYLTQKISKANTKSIGTILTNSRFKQKNVTQNSNEPNTIKRVKSKYRF